MLLLAALSSFLLGKHVSVILLQLQAASTGQLRTALMGRAALLSALRDHNFAAQDPQDFPWSKMSGDSTIQNEPSMCQVQLEQNKQNKVT